jgi:hypothetical protein
MKRLFLLSQALIILFVFSGEANAQSYELRGSLRELVKIFTKSPNELDIAETRLKLELLSTIGENTSFKVKSYSTYGAISRETNWNIQEAFIDYYSDLVDVRLGKQVIAWGKADEINPTDILNPQDIFNISEEKNIRKIGLTALKTEWKLSEYILEAIWKMEYDNMKFPPMDSRWALFTIPGLEALPEPDYPQNRIQDTEWAFKLSRTISLFDLSISYFDGWDNISTLIFSFDPIAQQAQLEKLKFFRTKMIGADFAGSVSSFGLWGEAAYFITESNNDPLIKNPYLQYVIGSDYTFDNGVKINLQYFQEINKEKSDEEIVSKLGFGIPLRQASSFRLEKKFGEIEEHSIEIFGIYDIKDHGLSFQPKLILSPEDAFDIEFGLIFYYGEKESVFGRFENNDQVYLKGTYSF